MSRSKSVWSLDRLFFSRWCSAKEHWKRGGVGWGKMNWWRIEIFTCILLNKSKLSSRIFLVNKSNVIDGFIRYIYHMPYAAAYKQLFLCSFGGITMVSAAIYYRQCSATINCLFSKENYNLPLSECFGVVLRFRYPCEK